MSDKSDNFQAHDLLVAASLLSRLPVSVDHGRAGQRAAAAVWAYPLVGAFLGAMAGILGVVLHWLSLPDGMVATAVLLALVITSGAMHEDGLADFADGIWGGATPDKRLSIMKDSLIGAYGAVALMLFMLARFSGISALEGWNLVLILAAIGAASRALMVAVMFIIDPAKPSGLSAGVGQPSAAKTGVALLIGVTACVILTGLSGIFLFMFMALAAIPVAALALKKLGGQTGDVLGTVQQCCEVVGLAAAVALI